MRIRIVQIGLKRQQAALAEQLRQALELHLHPRTAVDTVTVADKAINVLEKIIQAHLFPFHWLEAGHVQPALLSCSVGPRGCDTEGPLSFHSCIHYKHLMLRLHAVSR